MSEASNRRSRLKAFGARFGSSPAGILTAVVLASRAALYGAGLRFYDAEVDSYMPFLDVRWLETDLLQSLFYLHAQPPAMNGLVGLMRQSLGASATVGFALTFSLLGVLLAASLADLLRQVGTPRRWAFGLTLAFMLSPPVLLFETFLLHTYPAAALVTATLAAFGRALDRGGGWWTACFVAGALLCLTRSVFHLVWLLGLVGGAVAVQPGRRRAILFRAALPAGAVVAWYTKNLVLVGVFGASSWLGLSLAKGTTGQLPAETRAAWVKEGRLHPVARVDPFAGPRAYVPHVDLPPPTGVPALDTWTRSSGAPNYNHRVFPVASGLRQANALAVLREQPGRYLRTAARDLLHWMSPATTWHPREPEGSPFRANRWLLGRYEDAFNAFVHVPVGGQPVGLVLFTPVLLLGALVLGARRMRTAGEASRRRGALVLAVAGTGTYGLAVCCLVETGVELSRMRFMVDALLLTTAAALIVETVSALQS
jgi:hypothetical protein